MIALFDMLQVCRTLKHQREYPAVYEIGPMDPREGLRQDNLHSEKLRQQSRASGLSLAVVLSGDDNAVLVRECPRMEVRIDLALTVLADAGMLDLRAPIPRRLERSHRLIRCPQP